MDYLLRFGTGVYGERVVLGLNWDLLAVVTIAAALMILVHAVAVPIVHRRQAQTIERRERNSS
jgi:ABC-type bacteriocin/lantibiotic exporter with double-glycine peptidase domain